MDVNSVRVHAPTSVVLVCGGQIDVKAPKPKSLREAFMRVSDRETFPKHTALLAEELNGFFPRGGYKDILTFESDIAQISDLIVLFTESFGSAAELGAFSFSTEIAPRLLVIIDDYYYNHNSFIKLGPILCLEKEYGTSAICVLNRSDINITRIDSIDGLNISVFSERVSAAFSSRINTTRARTTFNKNIIGHIIKFVVGLIQHYGALTLDEIDVFLYQIGVSISSDRLADLLLCAEFAEWIFRDRRGLNNYYLAKADKEALQYKLIDRFTYLDKFRWRADIREYWKLNEPDRFSSISQHLGRRLI